MNCHQCRRPLPPPFISRPPVPFGPPRVCPDCRRREREDEVRREWARLTRDVGGESGGA